MLIHNGGSIFHDFQLATENLESHSHPLDELVEDYSSNEAASRKVWKWIRGCWAPDGSITHLCQSNGIKVYMFTGIACDFWHMFGDQRMWEQLASRAYNDFYKLRTRFQTPFHYVCMGSAVIHPEVFLKAISGMDLPDFTADVVDFLDMYRPRTRVAKYGTYYKMTHKEYLKKWIDKDDYKKVLSKEHKSRISKSLKGKNNPFYGKKHSEETKKKISDSSKGRVPWNKGKIGIYTKEVIMKIIEGNKKKIFSKETRKKISESNKLTISKIKNKYPLFLKIEKIRYNPDKPKEKEIQVHCKNHLCKNSKEQNGWFTPTKIQLSERIRQLESIDGNGGSYFYCSDECKNECPLFNLKGDPLKENEKSFTESEYQIFRKHVLKRDNYKCQYCGEQAEHIHHERPQKLESFFALDPDFAWSCCEKCHYAKGHKNECSTGNLANIICK